MTYDISGIEWAVAQAQSRIYFRDKLTYLLRPRCCWWV